MTALRGLTTMVLTAEDVEEAARWYSEALGLEPYFRNPQDGPAAYVEFRIGPDEDELGIMDRRYAPPAPEGTGTVTTYWHVPDVAQAVDEFISRGAAVHAPVTVRGDEGFVTASVTDPFGNILGLMHSPHWAGRH